jgi:MYXO-CTERM domain-containing protein
MMLPAATAAASDDAEPVAGDLVVPPTDVVGGSPVPEGKWPDTAGVYFGSQIGCTGVLVAPTVVLTAGHCIDNSIGQVLLGANNINGPGEVRFVDRRIAYPSWWNTYDIGILTLRTPSTIEPRLIATGCVRDGYIANGAPVTIVGYGATDNNANVYVDELLEAMTEITDFDCSSSGKGCAQGARPAGELGAGGMGIDSCDGDSGGPLYLNTPIGDFVVGLTSRGYEDNSLRCSQGGIYVRPDAVIEWIEQQGGVSLPRPTCNMPPEPTAEPINVGPGETSDTAIAPNDPDTGDMHLYVLAAQPEHGTAEVAADGTVEYTAGADYEGTDIVVVTVTDNGVPALSTDIAIDVSVEPGGGCGCRGSEPASGGVVLVVLVGWATTRRRRTTTTTTTRR